MSARRRRTARASITTEASSVGKQSGEERLYKQLIEKIFFDNFTEGAREVVWERSQIQEAAKELGIPLPKNLGDLVYSMRYRADLPQSVQAQAPRGMTWVILPAGRSRYRFVPARSAWFEPRENLSETKIPDATPGIIARYAFTDEQALLAKLRYNRLIDIFSGVTCYSLQSHLRTAIPDVGQVETDELYVGVDKRGAHYVFPVQAKGARDRLGVVQVWQDMELCAEKFPDLVCRPIGAQFIADDLIAMFEFERGGRSEHKLDIRIVTEKHYRLVPHSKLSRRELAAYRGRLE